jgi:membrane-bound inhibitor of C-type lysozyme
MTSRQLLLVVLFALPACASEAPSASSKSAQPSSTTYVYTCPDGYRFTVVYGDGKRANLQLPGAELKLRRVEWGWGDRYADGDTVLSTKGKVAALEGLGLEHRGCQAERARDVWEAAKLRGADFRAVGSARAWWLEIDNRGLTVFAGDDGATRVALKTPPPSRDGASGVVTYRVETSTHALSVIVEERRCSDTETGDAFPKTVFVTVDGRTYQGCGTIIN